MCVWTTVWKPLLQHSTKSPRELVESSVAAADPQADENTWSHVILDCGRKVMMMMMILMKLPLQTGYTILSEGCSCPTMPNDNEDDFVLDSSRLVRAVIR